VPRAPAKTAFFAAARLWDSAAAAAMLAASPGLAVAADQKGRTALHLACAVRPGTPGLAEPDGIATVTALLAAGAALEAAVPMDEDDFRATPLWYAVARGENPVLVRFLLGRGADASSSLWAAVWRDDAQLMADLLHTHPRLDLRADGETPVFYAARLRRLRTLDLLIAAGADPSIPDHQGRDTLAIAQARRLAKDVIARIAEAARRPSG